MIDRNAATSWRSHAFPTVVWSRAGVGVTELSGRIEGEADRIAIGTMHFAKGLEFKAVAVMACDESVIPCRSAGRRV